MKSGIHEDKKNSSWPEKGRNSNGRIHDQTKVKTAIIASTDRYNDDGDAYDDDYKHPIQDSLLYYL